MPSHSLCSEVSQELEEMAYNAQSASDISWWQPFLPPVTICELCQRDIRLLWCWRLSHPVPKAFWDAMESKSFRLDVCHFGILDRLVLLWQPATHDDTSAQYYNEYSSGWANMLVWFSTTWCWLVWQWSGPTVLSLGLWPYCTVAPRHWSQCLRRQLQEMGSYWWTAASGHHTWLGKGMAVSIVIGITVYCLVLCC